MEREQLIVVVEGTAAIGPFWHTILSDYLEKIVRSILLWQGVGKPETFWWKCGALFGSISCPWTVFWLATDWKQTMQIVRLISSDYMNNKQYTGKCDYLVFRVLNHHGFLAQLQEKKLCAVIQLPSQTLLLSVSDKPSRLIGMLFPGDMVVFKPQPSSQPQVQQQLQQQLPPQQPQQQQLQQTQQQPQQLQQALHPSQLQHQPQQQQIQQLQQQQLQHQQQQQLQHQPQQQQQQHQLQQQHQQMVNTAMNQAFGQGQGRSQMMSQGQMMSQAQQSMPGGGFLS